MNTVYELSATIPGVSIFIGGNILIGNWFKWAIATTTSNSSVILLVANRAAMSLACVYALVALFTLLKNRKKMITGTQQLKVAGNGSYTITEPCKKNDKMGRFLDWETLTHFNLAR